MSLSTLLGVESLFKKLNKRLDEIEVKIDKILDLSKGEIKFIPPEHVMGDIYHCKQEDLICLDCNQKHCKTCNYTDTCIYCGSKNLWVKYTEKNILHKKYGGDIPINVTINRDKDDLK